MSSASVDVRTRTYTRRGNGQLELPYEKPVVVPQQDENDPAVHAWADARFWSDIMSEHALFFALLMRVRREALKFVDALQRAV